MASLGSAGARESVLFDEHATALQVVDGIDLSGRTALVTGASSGIGVETARALASAGARVVMAVRDVRAGRQVADDLRASTGTREIEVRPLDLADPPSVRAFAEDWQGPLHILVANAGIMHAPEMRTSEGREMHFAVNHLGHFALSRRLHRAMADAGGARVVSVSSSGHAASGIRFADVDFRHGRYDPALAYGQSKTANVLFAVHATTAWRDDGIVAAAVMPGGIWTNLQRWWDPDQLAAMKKRHPGKSAAQGAATSVYVATRAALGPGAPAYWEDCRPAEVVPRIVDGLHGVVAHALDPEAAERLWALSSELTASVGGAAGRS